MKRWKLYAHAVAAALFAANGVLHLIPDPVTGALLSLLSAAGLWALPSPVAGETNPA